MATKASFVVIICLLSLSSPHAMRAFRDAFTTVSSSFSASTLFITSFQFTSDLPPSFVDYSFGSKALHYSESLQRYNYLKITPSEIADAHQEFSKNFQLPARDKNPNCSISMLGFYDDTLFKSDHSFAQTDKSNREIVGLASLLIKRVRNNYSSSAITTSTRWKCYYRNMIAITSELGVNASLNSLVFYCPSNSQLHCDAFSSTNSSMNMLRGKSFTVFKGHLTIPALRMTINHAPLIPNDIELTPKTLRQARENASLEGTFRAKIFHHREVALTNNYNKSKAMAVCAVIPYVSKVPGKQAVASAILDEWINHYVTLGFQVHLYDQRGAHMRQLKEYSRKITTLLANGDFIYHDYTIRNLMSSLIDGVTLRKTSSRHKVLNATNITTDDDILAHYRAADGTLQFDNTVYPEGEAVRTYVDFDKSFTYSHCRHELSAIWGIENVLIADHDEFMYCPPSPKVDAHLDYSDISWASQRNRVRSLVKGLEDKHSLFGYIRKMALRNTSNELALDCAAAAIASNRSIFHCFGDFNTSFRNGFYKSFHMGHKCVTTFPHEAAITHRGPRYLSCGELNYEVFWRNDDCVLLHLVLLPNLVWGVRTKPPSRDKVKPSELLYLTKPHETRKQEIVL